MVKILVCGDVNGHFTALFKRLEKLVKKDPNGFDALYCTGSFFAHDGTGSELDAYLNGEQKIPIQIYILGPVLPAQTRHYAKCPTGGDLCENLTFLGTRGVLQLSSGLSIAYLSGSYNARVFNSPPRTGQVYYTSQDTNALLDTVKQKGFRGVDILLTCEWSKGICEKATPPPGRPPDAGSCIVSLVATKLMPRYHFTGQECNYFERPPYRNQHGEGANAIQRHATRFLGLADVANDRKAKWLYAVAIDPLQGMSPEAQKTAGYSATISDIPFDIKVLEEARRAVENDSSVVGRPGQKIEENGTFFFRQKPQRGRGQNHAQGRKRPYDGGGMQNHNTGHEGGPPLKRFQPDNRQQQQQKPVDNCWFCLSSPTFEKHFVVNIGEQVYCAMAKGALDEDHILVLPISHLASSLVLDVSIRDEMNVMKKALRAYFADRGKVCVFFERNIRSRHLHIQVIGVPKEKEAAIETTLKELATPMKIEFETLPKETVLSKHVGNATQEFFVMELPNGTMMYHQVKGHFPLQFGRMVLGSKALLDMPTRVNWKNCLTNKEQETSMTHEFRKRFAKFDPFGGDEEDDSDDE